MANFDTALARALSERKQQQRYRSRRELQSAQSSRVSLDGTSLINFCSNDYLGLANHPEIVERFQRAASELGVGSGASHLVCGHSVEHHQLELELAEFCGRDRALVFSTGYMANLGVITALLGKSDAVFEDKLNHASLLDGGLSSAAAFTRYRHGDLDDLERRLEKSSAEKRLIVSDGVFSMDGDTAPLSDLSNLAKRHNAWLMVDDAHGFGCMGKTGGGLAQVEGLTQDQLPVLVGTFGKAFGTFGAFVTGSETLIETLIQFARTYIYTTALPPAVAAATRESLRIVHSANDRREKLKALQLQLKKGCEALDLNLMPSDSPIQPLMLGADADALALSERLKELGFWVSAIRPPTVPEGSARLRITLCANHDEEQLDALLRALDASYSALKIQRRAN